jgi:hypothetical protein
MTLGSKPDVGFILYKVTLEPNFLKVLQLFPPVHVTYQCSVLSHLSIANARLAHQLALS